MQEMDVTSWEQFVGLVDRLDVGSPTQPPYAYRGQSDASWGLVPSLVRKCQRFGVDEEQALRIEEFALTEFRSQAHLHVPPNIFATTTDALGWWTLMQHHGAPTRLLDWCASPYVAAYFAVVGHPDSPGALWWVHTHTVHSAMAEKYEGTDIPKRASLIPNQFLRAGAPPVLIFVSRNNKTVRMVAQQGLFSISRQVLGDHGNMVGECIPEDSSQELFRKVVIPESQKSTFLRKLRHLNITASSLFPGLDGLARSVDELIQISGE